ncbi:MAG: undecaprenyl-diphosphate phosphatase [Candidatus Shapirobacteria bacterium]
MNLFQSLLLGVTQGISEFLPISSSGHLNLLQYFFGFTPSLSLDIFLNTATLFSVLFFFKNQIKYFFENLKYIIVASIPAALVGIFLKDQVEIIFGNIHLLPYFFLITSSLLISTKFITNNGTTKLNFKSALIIGLMQSLAILPAVSRSGSTITMALWLGLAPLEAFNFSFCLFIVASLGTILLDANNLFTSSNFSPLMLSTFLITFLAGIIALYFLKKVVISKNLWYFGVYTLILALILFYVF